MRRRTVCQPAAIVLLAICMAACEAPAPSVEPTPSPVPTPTPARTSLPTADPARQEVIAVPAADLVSLQGIGPWAAAGSTVYGLRPDDTATSGPPTVVAGDLTTGRITVLAVVPVGHAVAAMAGTPRRVAWVETWREPPPAPPASGGVGAAVPGCADVGSPLRWRLWTVAPGAAPNLVTSGVNVRTAIDGECADVNPPLVALSGDRLAYTREATTVADPLADDIVVLSLATTGRVREITTHGLVRDLGLSGTVVAYRECRPPIGETMADPFDCLVIATSTDDEAPGLLDGHASALAVGGGRLAWARQDARDGSIQTTVLGSGSIARVPAPGGAALAIDGSGNLATADGLVAWEVKGTEAGDGTNSSALAVWLAGDAPARFIGGYGPPDFVATDGAWLVWKSEVGTSGGAPAGLYGVLVSALPKAAP